MCASAGILASASYRTTCGKVFTSTGPENYPGGIEEYNDWLEEMNLHFCGVKVMPQVLTQVPDEEPIIP